MIKKDDVLYYTKTNPPTRVVCMAVGKKNHRVKFPDDRIELIDVGDLTDKMPVVEPTIDLVAVAREGSLVDLVKDEIAKQEAEEVPVATEQDPVEVPTDLVETEPELPPSPLAEFDLNSVGTQTGRMHSDLPNEANTPKTLELPMAAESSDQFLEIAATTSQGDIYIAKADLTPQSVDINRIPPRLRHLAMQPSTKKQREPRGATPNHAKNIDPKFR